MKKRFFIIIFLFLAAFSCGKKKDTTKKETAPVDIVSADEMTNIMVDVLLAEGEAGLADSKHQNIEYFTRHYYGYVMKKHNITNEQFKKSYTYYAADIEEMLKIMTNVIDNLSQKQSKVRNGK